MRPQKLLPATPTIAMISTAVLLLLALWGLAFADQVSPETPATQQPPETEFAPRGQRIARDIKYGEWRKVCFKTPGTNMVCRTTISGTWETGQSAVRVGLIERQGESAARLQLFLPVGVYLQTGVKLSVDQGAQYKFPFVWSLTNTCIAALVADPNLIQEMDVGKQLRLEVVDSSILTVSTSLPLDRFATAHKSDPAQTFRQDIDE